MPLDLTPFAFTPTESLVYGVLVTDGPGTGYAVAKSAGLARANAYSALEGLVSKGAARVETGRPRRFRPEPPSVLLARIVDRQGQALEDLARALEEISVPASPTLTEVSSLRGALRLLSLEVARARTAVLLCLPAEAYAALTPALRRAAGLPSALACYADAPVENTAVAVTPVAVGDRWPGRPALAVVDDRLALVGVTEGDALTGWWGTSPPFVAAARHAIERLAEGG